MKKINTRKIKMITSMLLVVVISLGIAMFFIEPKETLPKKDVETETAIENTEVDDKETVVGEEFFDRVPLQNNPYAQYKNYPIHSVEYLAYYINQYIGPYFNEEKNSVLQAISNNPTRIPIKLMDGCWKRTLSKDNCFYYSGEMVDNKPNGKGIVYRNNRDSKFIAFGNFKEGKLEGYGITSLAPSYDVNEVWQHSTDSFFEGEISKGIITGPGLLYVTIGESGPIRSIYVGAFAKNAIVQPVKAKLFRREESDDHPILIYYGDFNPYFQYNGEGITYYPNRQKEYDGSWKESKKNGKGTLYYPNGKIQYSGEFVEDVYDGEGTLYREDGSIEYKGRWVNNDIA